MKKVMKFVKGKKEEEPVKVINQVEPVKKSFSFEKSDDSKDDDFINNDKSVTKVHKAVWSENVEKVKSIIKINDIDITDKLDRTALYFAILKNNPTIVELLLENNANQNIPDIDGVTPFLKSIQLGYVDCVITLINHGADFKRVDKDLNTCLHYAINAGHMDILHILLENGMDCNVHNINGEYPIHAAVKNNSIEMVEVLLKHGAGVNAVDCKGVTALMLASSAGYLHIVNLLEKYNADNDLKDEQGKTAVDYASSNGYKEIVVKLRNSSIRLSSSNKPECSSKSNDSDSWNDSPVSARSEKQSEKYLSKISEHFLQEETDVSEKSESDVSIKRSENASPQSGVIPPPCKPLRSLEYLQAGMSSDNRPVHLLTLGTVRTRHISMTESEHSKNTTPHRYSYQGDLPQGGSGDNFHSKPPDLLSCIGDEKGDIGNVSGKSKHHSKVDGDSTIQSDWGSNESLPLDEYSCSGKKEIKIVPLKDGVEGRDNSFLQKQFSILENYEKNHSRNCSVSHEINKNSGRSKENSQRDLDDIANFLEDNNRINCQLEKYAGHSDILVMAKKSRSLPRNCQPGGLYQTGSMSLPRTLDSGKDFIRDMKRYGSYRPKTHNIFSSKSKNDSITSSKKHGFIDKLKNMFGKKSQVHLTTEIQDANNTWLKDNNNTQSNYEYDTISRKSCSSKHSSGVSERHSYSERIRSNTSSVHSFILKDHDTDYQHSDSKGCGRKSSTMGSTNTDLTHSRKSSSSRSFSEKISVETYKLDNEFKRPPFESKKIVVCEECRSYVELRQKEAEQTVLEKDSFITLLKSQMEELKNRILNSSTVILETKYSYVVAQQEIHVLKQLAKKYECEVRKLMLEKMHRKECTCNTSTLTDEPPDKWNKQVETDNEICLKKSKSQLEINTLKVENQKLEEHIEELQTQLLDSTERLVELENALSSVKKEMSDITYETQKEKDAVEEQYKLAVAQMNEEKFKLEEELNNIRRGYDKLQNIYSETRTAFDDSVNQHGNIIHENDTLKDENKMLLNKLCELEKQAASIKGSALIRNKVMWDRLRKNNINFVSSNRSSLEMINIHYEESRSDAQNIKADTKCICFTDSDTKLNSEKRIGPSLQEIMLEIEILNTEYCEMHIKLQEEELQKTLALLENENDRLKDQIANQNDKIMNMEIAIEELTRDNCEGCTKIEEVLDEHDQLKKAFEEMLAEIEKCRKELKTKVKTIKEQETNIARYIHDIQRWEQNVHDLEDKLNNSQNECDKKSIKISALETTKGEYLSKVYKLEDQLTKTSSEKDDLLKKINFLENEKLKMTENLTSAQQQIIQLDANFLECKRSIDKLKDNNDTVLLSFEELQLQSMHKEEEYEKKIELFKLKIEELSSENTKLKNTVEEQQIRSDNLLSKMESLTSLHQNEIGAKSARNNELMKEREKLKQHLSEFEILKKNYEESKLKCIYNENCCQDLIHELDNSKQELEIIKKELELTKCKHSVAETLDKENNEMKYAVEVLRSILDEDYERTVKQPVDISKIKLNLYTKLSTHISPSLIKKSNNSMPSKMGYKLKLSKIPQSMNKLKRGNFNQNKNNNTGSSTNLRTSSLPNLDEKLQKTEEKHNLQFLYHGSSEEVTTNTLVRKSSSLDNLKKLNEESEDEKTKCNERWEQQMKSIRQLKQEIKECTQKLNYEIDVENKKTSEDNTKKDDYYKVLVKNLQKQITELQAKSTQETCKNFSLESELSKLKGNMAVMSEMENEIKKLRVSLEKERHGRIKEIELSKIKKEEELYKCQEKFKKEFIEMEAKFKADLTMAENALKAKNIEEMKLKQKCEKLSKEVSSNAEAKPKKTKHTCQCPAKKEPLPVSSMFSYPITEPLPVACICAISGASQQTQILKDVMRTELDTSIKRHRLQSENVPVVDYNSEEDLRNKYLLK